MKRLICCAVAASLGCWNAGHARNVDLQSFLQPSEPKGQFVLQPPRDRQDDAAITPPQDDDLVRAFDSLAGGGPSNRETVERSAIGARRPGSERRPDRWLTSTNISTATFCASEPYRPNPALPPVAERRRATWYPAVVAAACEAGLPPLLLDALVIQESRYNPTALSAKGAVGISQLMPGRARLLGVNDVWNPLDNLRGGARYMRALLDEFGRFDLALAAYNAGEGRVRRKLEVPRIPETLGYVSGVLLTMRNEIAHRPVPVATVQQ